MPVVTDCHGIPGIRLLLKHPDTSLVNQTDSSYRQLPYRDELMDSCLQSKDRGSVPCKNGRNSKVEGKNLKKPTDFTQFYSCICICLLPKGIKKVIFSVLKNTRHRNKTGLLRESRG